MVMNREGLTVVEQQYQFVLQEEQEQVTPRSEGQDPYKQSTTISINLMHYQIIYALQIIMMIAEII